MAKNMTRKGLAIGTTFALTFAGLVGIAAPAQASTGITVEPSAGTSYNMISGEQLSLRVFGQSNYTGGFAALKWEVTNASAATVSAFIPASTGALAATTPATPVRDADFNPAGTSNASAATSFVITPQYIATATGANQLGVKVPDTATATLQVRAFIDLNGNGSFESATDLSANVATVNFVKPADVTTTTAITAPVQGDTAIVAKVEFNNINNEQVPAANVGAYFTKGDGSTLYPAASVTAASSNGTTVSYTAANNFLAGQTVTITGFTSTGFNLSAVTIATANSTGFTVTNSLAAATATGTGTASVSAAASVKSNQAWSATNKFQFTTSTVSALAKDSAVKVQPLYKVSGSPASTNTIGSASTALVVARKAATIAGDAVASTTAKVTTAGSAGDTLLNSSFQAKVVVKDSDSAAVAGAAVTATITSTGLQSTAPAKTLTVNGTTYSSSSALPGQGSVAKLALTTNASGEAVINFTTAGYSATNTVEVVFYTENLTSSTLTLTQRAAVYTATIRPSFFVTTDGTAVSVPVVVYDQFGGVPADKYDVRATFDSSNSGYVAQATTASTSGSNAFAPLVGGRATLSITDNGTGLGVNSYDITVQERLAGNNYGSAIVVDGSSATNREVNVHIVAAATLVPATVTSNGTQNSTTKVYEIAGPVALSLVTPTAYDSVTVLGAAPSTFTSALNAQNITGTVSTVANATTAAVVVPGAAVTVSGSGLLFQDATSGRFTVGSITVNANTSGVYDVNVYSNKAGKQTLSITSGAATATTTVVFAEAKDDTGAALTITAPDNILPGSTLSISVVLTDKYGNTVVTNGVTGDGFNDGTGVPTFSFTSDSPGFQIGSDPTSTGKGGKATLRYFLGANDKGTITVTASYDGDGTGTAKEAVTATKTITIGAAVAAQSTSVKRTGNAVAVRVTGYANSRIVLNGTRVASRSSLGTLTRTVNLRAGRNVIQIVVDGTVIRTVRYTR